MRLCSSAHRSLGRVVTSATLRIHSPAGERQFSHSPGQRHQASISKRNRGGLLSGRGLLVEQGTTITDNPL
jgi:hypothetical protein